MDDLIYRQVAIDALAKHEKSKGHNYTLFMDIVSECAEIILDLPSAQRWIHVSEKLPEANVKVIMQCRGKKYPSGYRYFQTVGVWIPKFTIRAQDKWTDESDCEEYDEKTDEYYCREGWYEECTQGDGDNQSWMMNAEVTAWQPMPESWEGEMEGL